MELHLYKRLTHKYQDGWSSLDESVYIGTAKMLSRRMLKDNGIDGRVHLTRVIAPASLGSTDLSDVISSTLSYSRCKHDFDCCGCATVSASVKKLSRRQYSVRLSTAYNV